MLYVVSLSSLYSLTSVRLSDVEKSQVGFKVAFSQMAGLAVTEPALV